MLHITALESTTQHTTREAFYVFMSFIHRSKMGERLYQRPGQRKSELDGEYDKGDTIYHVDSGKRAYL